MAVQLEDHGAFADIPLQIETSPSPFHPITFEPFLWSHLSSNHNGASTSQSDNDTFNNSSSRNDATTILESYSFLRLFLTLVVLGTIILAAVIGNVFVIAAVLLERNLHNVNNYLVASLASADLMVATLVMPLAAVNEISTRWFLGKSVCDMWVMFDVICCSASILHLVAISIDRYWAVTRVDYIHNRSAKRILLMVAISWCLALAISVPPLFFQKDPHFDPNESGVCMINQNPGYQIVSTVAAFYVPFVAVLIIYLKVFLAARKRIRKKRFRQSRRQQQMMACKDGGGDMVIALDAASNVSNASPTECYAETNIGSATGASLALMSPASERHVGSGSPASERHVGSCNGSAYHALMLNDANRNETKSSSRMTRLNHGATSPTGSPVQSPSIPSTHLSLPSSIGGNFQTSAACSAGGTGGGLTPVDSASLRGSFLDLTKQYLDRKPVRVTSPKTRERKAKEKLEQKRERKAARTLAIITGSFCICWLPFFIVAITRPLCGDSCHFPLLLLSIINWLGYLNSLLNPIIYTIFNPDFRLAFRKILFGKYRTAYNRRTDYVAKT